MCHPDAAPRAEKTFVQYGQVKQGRSIRRQRANIETAFESSGAFTRSYCEDFSLNATAISAPRTGLTSELFRLLLRPTENEHLHDSPWSLQCQLTVDLSGFSEVLHERLFRVFLRDVPGEDRNRAQCPGCSAEFVKREPGQVNASDLTARACATCGRALE